MMPECECSVVWTSAVPEAPIASNDMEDLGQTSKKAAYKHPPLRVQDLTEAEQQRPAYALRGLLHKRACELERECYVDPANPEEIHETRFYLLQRECCGERCRHCPYDYVNVPKVLPSCSGMIWAVFVCVCVGVELALSCLTVQLTTNLSFGPGVVVLVCLLAIVCVCVCVCVCVAVGEGDLSPPRPCHRSPGRRGTRQPGAMLPLFWAT